MIRIFSVFFFYLDAFVEEESGSHGDSDVPDNSSGKTKADRVTYSSSPESPEPSDREQAPRLVRLYLNGCWSERFAEVKRVSCYAQCSFKFSCFTF